jgi:hypothetical protein
MYNLFLFLEYFKVYHSKIMQFNGFLSVLGQKWLENHEIYYIEAAEYALGFQHCAPLLGWRYL